MPNPGDAIAVRGTGITVAYGATPALADASFTLDPGTSTALIGPNGAGKTTLLHVLAGLLRPTAGTLTLPHLSVAYVLQRHAIHAWMPLTVAEVIRMGRYRDRGLLRPLRRADRELCRTAATRMEVVDLWNRQFGELSGGQRQRVLVAQALAQDAPVLLLDEPVTGLDIPSQQRILEMVEEETARGVTVVLSTHALDEARHCDQVLLVAGRIVAAGPPDAVLTEGFLREAYAGRMLGGHEGHDHAHDLVVLDDHGHGTGPDPAVHFGVDRGRLARPHEDGGHDHG
jgi:ABC-type Mn2+/Zn2+ transport system ATPase subunit